MTCPGSLIVHYAGTIAGCTVDDDQDGCRGYEQRHEGSPVRCVDWTLDGRDYCGVHWRHAPFRGVGEITARM